MCQNHYHFHREGSIPLDKGDFDQLNNQGWIDEREKPRKTESIQNKAFPMNGVRFGQPSGALLVEDIGKVFTVKIYIIILISMKLLYFNRRR